MGSDTLKEHILVNFDVMVLERKLEMFGQSTQCNVPSDSNKEAPRWSKDTFGTVGTLVLPLCRSVQCSKRVVTFAAVVLA
eukprot:6089535-Amphidinium_carterae.1